MKRLRHNKVLGLAFGERSVLAAEVVGGAHPRIARLGELAYPGGNQQNLAELGAALRQFLHEKGFTARAAIVGLPAAWLLVKAKEVPPADAGALADLLRIQAESDFPADIQNLVFDYAGQPESGQAGTVLLLATPRKYLDATNVLCENARLSRLAVTPSALALSAATQHVQGGNTVVLAVVPAGAEMTAGAGAIPSSLRRLRAAGSPAAFSGELRRAVSTLPLNGSGGELVVWDGVGLDIESLRQSVSLPIRVGQLSSLAGGISVTDGQGMVSKYAAAVALGLAGTGQRELAVDFLSGRLAPPRKSRLPRSVVYAIAAGILIIAASIYGWINLSHKEGEVAKREADYAKNSAPQVDAASVFVTKVTFARGWHTGDLRYLNCLVALYDAVPNDPKDPKSNPYATNIEIHEAVSPDTDKSTAPAGGTAADWRSVIGVFNGNAPSQDVALTISRKMKEVGFASADLIKATVGRGGEINFEIKFQYSPPPPPAVVTPPARLPGGSGERVRGGRR